jgi:hypothetical protein
MVSRTSVAVSFSAPLLKPSEAHRGAPVRCKELGAGVFGAFRRAERRRETKRGPKGRERDLARPRQGQGYPFRGPTEASEA